MTRHHSAARSGYGPRYFLGPSPRALAHRGFAPCGEENTLAAFARALELGAHVIETDTRATRDGIALTFHDATVDRVCPGETGLIRERAALEVTRLKVAAIEPIPRLDEALDAFPESFFNIDVKDSWAVDGTVEAIRATGSASRVCLTSFDPAVGRTAVGRVTQATGIAPRASASRTVVAGFRALVAARAPQSAITRLLAPYCALQIPTHHKGIPLVTPRTIAAAHAAGCEMHVWTIDETHAMKTLLEMGVDGIVSNRVDRLVALLRSGDVPPVHLDSREEGNRS